MAGVAGLFANRARDSATSAQASADTALARELAAATVGNLDVAPARSILRALQAVSTAKTTAPAALREAEEALAALEAPPSVSRFARLVGAIPSH